MIPILYRSDEIKFTSNGLGRLTDCISCIVTEERNGIYEVEFQYPITGKFYKEMVDNGGIISVIHDDTKTRQNFDIYAHTDPIDGIVTFNAHHISYRLNRCLVKPFTAATAAEAIARISQNTLTYCPFTFWTDKATVASFNLDHPANIREILCGTEGSILDTYGGGDYQYNNFEVRLYTNRGNETDVTIRYGKNLADITQEYDKSGTFSAVLPYWSNGETTVIGSIIRSATTLQDDNPWTDENMVELEDGRGNVIYFNYPVIEPTVIDFSSDFEEEPTVADLNAKAQSFMASNKPWLPFQNITVDFVQLWQTPEYENVANLQRVRLCDLVSVYYPELGIIASSQKVIRVVYNVLLERYDEMELGTAKISYTETIASTVAADIQAAIEQERNYIEQRATELQQLVEHQTELITGGLGGHVVMNLNADGEPQEILIMDTDDIDTAVNVLRLNKNGIGFSTNGYSGPYASAWTIDGKFNADFISAGSISANLIQSGTLSADFIHGGTLALGGLNNAGGVIQMLDQNADLVGFWNNGYFQAAYEDGYIQVGTPGLIITAFGTQISAAGVLNTGSGIKVGGLNFIYHVGSDFRDATIAPGYFEVSYATESGGQLINDSTVKFANQGTTYDLSVPNTKVFGNFYVTGTKSRVSNADDFGMRSLYCYETPSPLFGDVGEGVIDETGYCYVFLDPVFAETITTTQYQVFLQRYGHGDCYVAERKPDYFVVCGEPGLAFGWELKAKQKDFDQLRLEKIDDTPIEKEPDYGELGCQYYSELEEGRIAA